MTTESLDIYAEPERLLVVRNPYSSNDKQAAEQIAVLEEAGWRTEEVFTSLDPLRTEDEIAARIRAGDMLVSSGGDGTANRIINAMYHLDLQRHMVLLAPGGNANDISCMLHGRQPLLSTVRHGRVTAAYAIQTTIELPDGGSVDPIGAGYVGVGATGEASAAIDVAKKKRLHKVREALAAWRAVGTAEALLVQPDYPGSPLLDLKDVSAMKGPRIAKYGKTPADISQPHYFRTLTAPGGMVKALDDMLDVQRGTKAGDIMEQPFEFFVDSHDGKAPVWIHHDGEANQIPSASRVIFKVTDAPYYTLSTNLPPADLFAIPEA